MKEGFLRIARHMRWNWNKSMATVDWGIGSSWHGHCPAREVRTPAHEVALEVGRQLGWPVYDHELVEQVAADLRAAGSGPGPF